jgi:hypothetical protein
MLSKDTSNSLNLGTRERVFKAAPAAYGSLPTNRRPAVDAA